MQLVLFWVLAVLMLLFGAAVVFLRNPVSNALSLVMSFVFLAALFITLDAFFIGVVQVLVYAGAVMVLFLFIIMLLDLRTERPRRGEYRSMDGRSAGALRGLLASWEGLVLGVPFDMQKPILSNLQSNDVAEVGMTLFRDFNLPFQLIGVLLLVATVGVVILSKKELK